MPPGGGSAAGTSGSRRGARKATRRLERGAARCGRRPRRATHTARRRRPTTRSGSAQRTARPASVLLRGKRARAQVAAFALDQLLQFVEQLDIMLADGFDQIGKRQRGRTGTQELTNQVSGGGTLQFFRCMARAVAEGAAFGHTIQKIFLVQAVEGGHDRGVRQLEPAVFDHLTHGGASALPKALEKLLLEGAKVRVGMKRAQEPVHDYPCGPEWLVATGSTHANGSNGTSQEAERQRGDESAAGLLAEVVVGSVTSCGSRT